MPTTNRPPVVIALMLALFMAAMEMTVVSTAMPTVIAELGGIQHYGWVFTAYMLTSTVSVPIYGKLADLYGRKPVFLTALGLFLAGSMASGQANTMTALIVFRALQGIGAGGVQPIALTIIGDIFSLEERARMQGLFGAVWGVAGLIGPMLGGVIVATLSWRWVFYVNVPFGALSAVLVWRNLHENIAHKKLSLDLIGALLLVLAVVALLFGADGVMPWVLLPTSALLTAAFVLVERKAPEPMLPLDLFSERVVSIVSTLSVLTGGAMIALVTFVPLFAQGTLGASPTQAGAVIAPMAIAWPIASAIAGRLFRRLGFRVLVRGGVGLVLIASIGLAVSLSPGVPLQQLGALSALFGAGMGFNITPQIIAVQSVVSWERRGIATASTMFFRNIGGTVAAGVLGAVLAHAVAGKVSPELLSRILGPERRSIDAGQLASLSGELATGLGTVMWATAAIVALAFVVAWMFPRLDPAALASVGSSPKDELPQMEH